MSKTLICALAGGVVLVIAGAATSASAADPGFCRGYARAAERQVRGAEEHRRCFERIDNNPARWTTDYRAHFDWCRGVSREQADAERDARRRTLERCAHEDRDHDHDHDHGHDHY
jgi:hypothetical protein